MLDNLQEVFGAATVGLLALGVLSLVPWLLTRPDVSYVRYWWKSFRRMGRTPSLLVVSVPFVFGFGLIIQDFTDNLTDSEYKGTLFVAELQHRILGSEGDHRVKLLFRDGEETGLWNNISSELGYISRILHRTYPQKADEVRKFLQSPAEFTKRNRDQALSFVNTVYYEAKNWAYAQDTYFDELESIQRRIDFSRSTFLVATWGIAGILLVSLFVFARLYFQDPKTTMKSEFAKRFAKVLVLLMLVSFFGCVGYDRSETNFNERAFGYFFSHLRPEMSSITEFVDARLQGNLWIQTSGEYEAIARQTFRTAFEATLDRVCGSGVSASSCTTPVGLDGWRLSEHDRPYAFVMDLDETILDNAAYQSLLIITGQLHSDALWNDWIQHSFDDVGLVPGAEEFLQRLATLRVAPIFISNRPEAERQATVATLMNLGVSDEDPLSRLLLKTNSSSKDARRALIENKYEVVGFIGDNLGDFRDEFNQVDAIEERLEVVRRYQENWGTNWFTLPNPVYGNWQAFAVEEPIEKFLSIARKADRFQ